MEGNKYFLQSEICSLIINEDKSYHFRSYKHTDLIWNTPSRPRTEREFQLRRHTLNYNDFYVLYRIIMKRKSDRCSPRVFCSWSLLYNFLKISASGFRNYIGTLVMQFETEPISPQSRLWSDEISRSLNVIVLKTFSSVFQVTGLRSKCWISNGEAKWKTCRVDFTRESAPSGL